MKSGNILGKKVLEVLAKELKELKKEKNSMMLARKILAESKKVPLEEQLRKLKFAKADIAFIFRLIYEAVNKVAEKYYTMEEIDKLFNLTGQEASR